MPQPHTLIFLLFIFPKWGEVRRGEIAVILERVRGLADSYFELFASLFCINLSNGFLDVFFLHFFFVIFVIPGLPNRPFFHQF